MGRGAHLAHWVLKVTIVSPGWSFPETDFQQGGSMKSGGKLLAAALVAAGLLVPATASATPSAKVTDDAGNPVALTPGAPPALRKMDVQAFGNVETTDGLGF